MPKSVVCKACGYFLLIARKEGGYHFPGTKHVVFGADGTIGTLHKCKQAKEVQIIAGLSWSDGAEKVQDASQIR